MTDDRDLVTRLREYRMDVDSPDVVAEAADEIERLRRLLAVERQRIAEEIRALRQRALDNAHVAPNFHDNKGGGRVVAFVAEWLEEAAELADGEVKV
jgi:hypothetical protein